MARQRMIRISIQSCGCEGDDESTYEVIWFLKHLIAIPMNLYGHAMDDRIHVVSKVMIRISMNLYDS